MDISKMSISLKNTLTKLRYNQTGSVLPVSLFILLVLTIIGATSLNDTLMQEKMSSNFQKGNIAFQAAESSINKTFITISNNRTLVLAARQARDLADANDEDPVWPVTTQYTMRRNHSDSAIHSQSETTLNSTVRYVGDNLSPAAGCSIVIGRGTSCMAAVVEVVGTGAIAGTTVSRTHIQGTQKIVPSGG